MKVGLYFGSFNPIHVGHMIIANYMLEYTSLDELWFVISPHNPLKEKASLLPDYHRYQMVFAAIEPYPKMRASKVEFNLPKPSYTITTLTQLSDEFPEHKFSIIVGGDSMETFEKWQNYDKILEYYHVFVYNRPYVNIPEKFQNHTSITYIDAPLMEISSSFIRQSIAEKKNVRALMPEQAWKYLDEMNFYKK